MVNHNNDINNKAFVALPEAWWIAMTNGNSLEVMDSYGEISKQSLAEFEQSFKQTSNPLPIVCCHIKNIKSYLKFLHQDIVFLDILELYAFVYPANFCAPTVIGIAQALKIYEAGAPQETQSQAMLLFKITEHMLNGLMNMDINLKDESRVINLARVMEWGRWSWAGAVFAALGLDEEMRVSPKDIQKLVGETFNITSMIKEWSDEAPPRGVPLEPGIKKDHIAEILKEALGVKAEERQMQQDYSQSIAEVFTHPQHENSPQVVLAEAGTGIGKTLGYLAPAKLWAEASQTPVWISTYTRNLQHQIKNEIARLYPNEAERKKAVVLRKGRENYLCFLNFAEASQGMILDSERIVPLTLMFRWLSYSEDGDMTGGDFPTWMQDILGFKWTSSLKDQRGECLHGGCSYYRRCFVENVIRKAEQADIVIANHALTMFHLAYDPSGGRNPPGRIIFDEGHHLYNAADSVFSITLSLREAYELRRWIRGYEGGSGRRKKRGLSSRLEGLIDSFEGQDLVDQLIFSVNCLPNAGWQEDFNKGQPQTSAEQFLFAVAQHVRTLIGEQKNNYGFEVPAHPVAENILAVIPKFDQDLLDILKPAKSLIKLLHKQLIDNPETLDENDRGRIEALYNSIDTRIIQVVQAWRDILIRLSNPALPPSKDWFDWFKLDQQKGGFSDINVYCNAIDPMVHFTNLMKARVRGYAITSATLTNNQINSASSIHAAQDLPDKKSLRKPEYPADQAGLVGQENLVGWTWADLRNGINHLQLQPQRYQFSSPFDYQEQAKVLIVNDVNTHDIDQLAMCYRELFIIAKGGGMGLFTAIERLRNVHKRIIEPLADAGLPLYSQHINPMNLATLLDIFKIEKDACLLGTDAVRDGVDVPGNALRLIVFEKTPWMRPDLLFKVRKKVWNGGGRGSGYDEAHARANIRQAFGRLIRRKDDRGVFVILDRRFPSSLKDAFPPGVEIERCSFKTALQLTNDFLEHNEN